MKGDERIGKGVKRVKKNAAGGGGTRTNLLDPDVGITRAFAHLGGTRSSAFQGLWYF